MKNNLGIVVCENFIREIEFVVKNSNMENIIISHFVSQCGFVKERQNSSLIEAIRRCEEKCNKIIIIGGACCRNLEGLIIDREKYKIHILEYCFELFTNKNIIQNFVNEKVYIVTPGWLKNWKINIDVWGFDKENARIFFREFAVKIRLLDTGTDENSLKELKELSEYLNIQYDSFFVGLDFFSMFIEKNILEWKLEWERKETTLILANTNRKSADYAMVFELISSLTTIMTEKEAIENIANLFSLFFGPEDFDYISINTSGFRETKNQYRYVYKEELNQFINLDKECIWNDKKNGFILKIIHKSEVLGILKVYGIAYPNSKEYYINFAIAIGRVCGLTISNSRKYEELKKTEKLLEKEKEQLSYILNSIYEGVFILDSNYNIIFVNKAIEKILDIKDFKSIIGKNVFKIIHRDYHEIVLKRFNKVISNRMAVNLIEEELIKYDGNTVSVEIYSKAIEYQGKWSILSVVKDISERKRTENLKLKIQEQSKLLDEAMEYDKLKTEFFANLSHELRTPLNVMISTLQLLNLIEKNNHPSENKEKVKKYYHIMGQNCYRLLRLVNNLIDITKIDAGYFKINLKNENIIAIIEDITLSVTDYAENKGLEIIFDTDIEEKIMACDSEKIERIILNLLSNAIKFILDGGKILVSIADKNSNIVVSVKDNGVGIPADMQDSIFERFIQVDKSLSRNREGSGIGLSLVKSLVELHGGSIEVVSEYGKGSEFIIELPVKVLPKDETTSLEANIAKASNIQRVNIEFSDIYD